VRISKVVTRTGDEGQTSLANGERVSKAALRVCAYGEVDELNSLIGWACAEPSNAAIQPLLAELQNHLFVLGADLSTPVPDAPKPDTIRRISADEVERLEGAVARYNSALPPLEEFILPGGSEAGARLHVARAMARRAERSAVALSASETINPQVLVYLNRLSDLLFVLARYVCRQDGAAESTAQFH
jgi:cob(I)alamin adenosyltransferase